MSSIEHKFSQIYDQYIEKIYRFVFVKVSSREIAEDITSKVFTAGWKTYKDKSEEIENLRAFLYQIARNLVIDHYREKAKAQFVSTEVLPNIVDPAKNLTEMAAQNADLVAVKNALTNLNDDYQNVIIWHYLDDMPIHEVSKLMNRSEDATRVLLHRALNSLRGTLES